MKSPHNSTKFHLWFPNLFEFKGGIQVYLQDVLSAIEATFTGQKFVVFDKLDRTKPTHPTYSKQISFVFSGNVPKSLQTLHFTWTLFTRALLERPNFILCGHLNFAPVALWVHRLTGIPYWILVYGVDAWSVQDPQKIEALRAAEKIVSISEYTRDRLVQEQHIPVDKIPLLPVTFDASRFAISDKPAYLLQRYGLTEKQPIILTVTRLAGDDRYKGYDQILQALPEIRCHLSNVHYVLVGKGNDRPRIEKLIQDLNLTDCVTLTGFVPDEELCDHYNLCDVFAMPSKGEGFGIVYLESLACGKPTLGGNQDGAIDALCQGQLGALVDPDNIDQLAHTLIQIIQGSYPNPLMYQPQALRQRVIEIYGFQAFQQKLMTILQTSGLELVVG